MNEEEAPTEQQQQRHESGGSAAASTAQRHPVQCYAVTTAVARALPTASMQQAGHTDRQAPAVHFSFFFFNRSMHAFQVCASLDRQTAANS